MLLALIICISSAVISTTAQEKIDNSTNANNVIPQPPINCHSHSMKNAKVVKIWFSKATACENIPVENGNLGNDEFNKSEDCWNLLQQRQALLSLLVQDFQLDVLKAVDVDSAVVLVPGDKWGNLKDLLDKQRDSKNNETWLSYTLITPDLYPMLQGIRQHQSLLSGHEKRPKRQAHVRNMLRAGGIDPDDFPEEGTLNGFEDGEGGFNFDDYHESKFMNDQMKRWVQENKDIARLDVVGESQDVKDPIYRLRLGLHKRRNNLRNTRHVFLEGGNHAREWITPAAVMFLAQNLIDTHRRLHHGKWLNRNGNKNFTESGHLQDEEHDEDVWNPLEHFTFHLAPMTNPDGYDASLRDPELRFWRKNRNPNAVPENVDKCIGVDLNRNFGFRWGALGASPEFCSEAYRGASAASESETKAVQNAIMSMPNRGRAIAISVHCCAGMVLMPYGYRMRLPDNHKELLRSGMRFARAAADASPDGRRFHFTVGASSFTLYPASGMMSDFAYGAAQIPMTFGIELPESGPGLFLNPPEDIQHIGTVFVAGMKSMLKGILEDSGQKGREGTGGDRHKPDSNLGTGY
ncbi:unnamed protein product [Notodromas monacha]|uniref:Peptidase M14 domain-containing protein n=1 Tax=Notodromas monacha TaxID=399045 RepID=A0A7R9GGN5_9CRUS|nr:unnamed protein product [Notodromas monacha]CAG0920395.1 unnamed protein product [Notodromas monacha]